MRAARLHGGGAARGNASAAAPNVPAAHTPDVLRAVSPPCRRAARITKSRGMSMAEEFCTIEEALAELRAGRMIVLVDDEHRENEGDLVIPAERATPEAINFMMHRACGMVCLAMSPAICDRLHLEPMAGATLDTKVTPLTQKF